MPSETKAMLTRDKVDRKMIYAYYVQGVTLRSPLEFRSFQLLIISQPRIWQVAKEMGRDVYKDKGGSVSSRFFPPDMDTDSNEVCLC